MMQVANYRFPPTNFDTAITLMLGGPSSSSSQPTPKAQEALNLFFDQHPVYSQRIITYVLRLGSLEHDEVLDIKKNKPIDYDSGEDDTQEDDDDDNNDNDDN
ncbi:hypothetical protein [Parasitella parasitica]|uniref:Uncharacterized protein n=1 Tax=Parasitella parasitica TaxID=35722 RepID=A0A0B7NAC4_9FUNG|nr:hypothetical protein [Parasitella parasitica]